MDEGWAPDLAQGPEEAGAPGGFSDDGGDDAAGAGLPSLHSPCDHPQPAARTHS
jgi:hypothetical protein